MVRNGNAWVELSDASGATAFKLAGSGASLSSVDFAGTGRIDRLYGYRAPKREDHRPCFYIRIR